MKKEDEKPEDEVIVGQVEETKEEKPIEVDTSEEQEKKTPRYITEEEFEKIRNQNSYTQRKLEKALKQLEEFTSRKHEPRPETITNDEILNKRSFDDFSDSEIDGLTNDKINMIAEQDWQLAVDLKSAKVIRQIEKKKQAEASKQSKESLRAQSVQRVYERYPSLGSDKPSRELEIYTEVLNEDPTLLQETRGAEIAMYRMEDKMRQMGMQPSAHREVLNTAVDAEVQRRQRIGASAIPHGGPSSSDKVVLTQEEIRTAKENNIPLKEFAKSYKLNPRDFKEGVTVDE